MPTETVREIKQFHSPTFLKLQRARLERARAEIVEHLSGARNPQDDRTGMGADIGDRGSQDTEASFNLTMSEKNSTTLQDITDALKRLDRGVYGICELSGDLIPAERLEVLPFARCTVSAQRNKERYAFRHRSYGVRFDDTPAPEGATD